MSFTKTDYEGDLTKVTPPKGGTPSTTVTDIEGHVVAVRQHTTASGVDGAYTETKYSFNRKDQQDRVIDAAGNEWASGFDAKGRLISSTDPDKGTTNSAYNELDELESTTDARGEKLFFSYDKIGRKSQVRDDSATGPLRAEWKYDTLYTGQTGFNGQLTQSIRYEPAGSANAYKFQVRGLNARYLATGVNYVIPENETGLDGTYIYSYKYSDVTGAQTSMSYPATGGLVTEEITTDYDSATGLPTRMDTSLTGSVGTMATASYTAYGERSGSIYKMPGGNWVQDIVDRDEDTRRTNRLRVKRETATGTVVDRHYSYDEIGNVLSIEDKPEVGDAEKQCFRLDPLGRLASAWTPKATIDCKIDPAVADLAGPAPYWQDWTFDTTGSRLTETSHAAAGNTLTNSALPKGGRGVVRPHAVTGTTTTAPGQAATTTYRYDNGGNMICRPVADATNNCDTNADSQTLAWNSEGELTSFKVGTTEVESNVHDADGTRLIRRDASGTTLYLPGQEVRKQGSSTIGTRYYNFAGTVCGSRKASSEVTALTWLFTDHQGTQQIALNAGTQAVTIRRQTPFGAPRGTDPAWVNEKGFVGGDNDPSGLVNIGARRYDTFLGRFITVDPVIDLADPQQWNAYSYAYNSPISHADSTGADPCPGGGGGCYYDGTTTHLDGVTKEQFDSGMKQTREYLAGSGRRERQRIADRAWEAENRDKAERARKDKECQASWFCRTGRKVKSAGSAAWEKVSSPQTVGILAGIGVGLACTALTGGGGVILCGALGGAVTGALTASLECSQGEQSKCGDGTLIRETLWGAGLGALGGVAGAAGGAFLKGGIVGIKGGFSGMGARVFGGALSEAKSAMTTLPKQSLAALREVLPRAGSRMIGGKASQNASIFAERSKVGWKQDVSELGGGAIGHIKTAGVIGRDVAKGMFTADGIAGGTVGGLAPTTRDDFNGLLKEGLSFDPVNTTLQITGGKAGGAFP